MNNIKYDAWLNRLDNLLTLQKMQQYDYMTMQLSRRELLELRVIISGAYEYELKKEQNNE